MITPDTYAVNRARRYLAAAARAEARNGAAYADAIYTRRHMTRTQLAREFADAMRRGEEYQDTRAQWAHETNGGAL